MNRTTTTKGQRRLEQVTANEVEILGALRVATDDTNPRLSGPAAKAKVEELAAVLTS